jgi:peptide/nickel transport system substrate-binding protein
MEESKMEGQGGKPLPSESAPKGKMTKTLAVVVVAILIVAAILGAVLLMGGGEENKAPTASLTVSSNIVTLGASVVLNGTTSSDLDGTIANYTWMFGDGLEQVTTGPVVSHTYGYPGKYIIVLKVIDDQGAEAFSWSNLIRVEVLNPIVTDITNSSIPAPLVASSATVITNGTLVDFNGADSKAYAVIDGAGDFSPGNVESYAWNFADGSAVVSGNLSVAGVKNHTFTGVGVVLGTYLTVTSTHAVTQRYYTTIVIPTVTISAGIKNPNMYVVAQTGEPDPLDPAYDYESAGGEILQNVYETLIWYDRESPNDLLPMLATNVPTIANGGVTPDGLNYTFNIKPNVHFHHTDGVDWGTVDAYDVEYSIERVLAMNDGWSPTWMLGAVMIPDYYSYVVPPQDLINASVEVTGTMTVVFHLTMPYPAFIQVLAYTVASVVCKEFVEAHGGIIRGESYNAYLAEHECGTGPYMLKEWARGQYILMERFDDYHRAPAALQYFIIKKVEDVGTRIMLLQSGDADSVYVPRQFTTDVRGMAGTRIIEGTGTFSMDFIGFNQMVRANSPLDYGNVTQWFFGDNNTRRAFAHAFDYETYLTETLLGTGIQPNGVIPHGMFGHAESVPVYDYNLTKAAAFLKLAINNVTGKSWADQGFSIYVYYNNGNLVREAGAFMIKDGLEKLTTLGLINGTIKVEVRGLEWSQGLLDAVRGRQIPFFFLGWAPDYNDPDDYTQPFYHEAGTYAYRCGISDAWLTQKVMDGAMELNNTERLKIYNEIEWHVYNQTYYLWTTQATQFHVERTWVQGWYYNPMYSGCYAYTYSKA